jgi:hypothetical protein
MFCSVSRTVQRRLVESGAGLVVLRIVLHRYSGVMYRDLWCGRSYVSPGEVQSWYNSVS